MLDVLWRSTSSPKDDTPGCRRESYDSQAILRHLELASADAPAISILEKSSKATFSKKYGLTFPLLTV